MGRVGQRRRRPRPRAPYYRSRAWYARRVKVQARAQGWCEWCQLRAMQHVHHRTYAHFGREPLDELMAVDALCHRAIHGLLPRGTPVPCAATSLRAQGDPGMGMSGPWRAYLAQQRVRRVAMDARGRKAVIGGSQHRTNDAHDS